MKKTKYILQNKRTEIWSVRSQINGVNERNFKNAQRSINFALAHRDVTHISMLINGVWTENQRDKVTNLESFQKLALELKKIAEKRQAEFRKNSAKKQTTLKSSKAEKPIKDIGSRELVAKKALLAAEELKAKKGESVKYVSKFFTFFLPIIGSAFIVVAIISILSILGYFV